MKKQIKKEIRKQIKYGASFETIIKVIKMQFPSADPYAFDDYITEQRIKLSK